MKIAFFGINRVAEKDFYMKNLSNHKLIFFNNPLTSKNIPSEKNYDLISVFINCRVDSKTIDAFPVLKAILARSTGIDNIDIEYAEKRKIKVFNVPSYGTKTVAEFTFALILSLVRNIPKAYLKLKEEKQFNRESLRGIDISGKTLGVIGAGKIGRHVIKIAKAFDMNVLCFDINPDTEVAINLGFEYVSLENLLKESDIVTLHTPATPASRNLINRENIYHMKNGAYLINTARGSVVETTALIEALESNSIAGAALDVMENENNLSEDEIRLLSMQNVIATPHVAFFTKEAEDRIAQTTLENILKFIS